MYNPINTPWSYIWTKDKFDGPIFGWSLYTRRRGEGRGGGVAYIRDKKYFNLQCVKLTFLSSFQYKARISAFSRRARCEICSKLTIKGVR